MEFSAGRVLGRGISVYFRRFFTFALLAVILGAPMPIYLLMLATGTFRVSSQAVLMAIGAALNFVTWTITVGAVTHGVFQELRGARASLVQCLVVGLSRAVAVVGVSLLIGVVCMLVAIVPGIIGSVSGSPIVGLIAMILPVLGIMTVYWVAVPATVVERVGAMTALNRSSELTRGRRGSIFAILLAIGLFFWGFQWVLGKAVELMDVSPVVLIVASSIFGDITGGVGAVATAVGYHDLRVAKEGVGTEELARVFD